MKANFLALSVLAILAIAPSVSAQTYSKTDTIEYHDDTALWVLGQVKRTTTDGIETSETTYGWMSLPYKTYSFGKLQQTFTYDGTSAISTGQRGTLKTVSDGRDTGSYNTTIRFSGWTRGIPELITHPDGTAQSAQVNSRGWIDWVKNEAGYTTAYTYDPMGRLESINYPDEPGLVYNNTAISFAPSSQSSYGLPSGHWKQVAVTGNAQTDTYFDALWRPIVKVAYDKNDIGDTISQTVTRYDAGGRPTFASYPQRQFTASIYNTWGNPAVAPNALGVDTQYDALGRVTRTIADSELGPLETTTEYLAGFNTLVTNPRSFKTLTSYVAYDQPHYDSINGVIQAYETADASSTQIFRDVFGKPYLLRRLNSDASVDVRRYYAYDAHQRLCRTIEPETGATLMGYDAAGNLAWSASGLPDTTACDAEGDTATILPRRVVREYDARNRVETLAFPDGVGDQIWTYTPDGLPESITTYNGANAAIPVINAYHYNHRRLLDGQGESISQPGWYTWSVGYGYNANGHLAVHTYPNNLTVDYAPNALGQPTQVGSFAADVSYYPNGAVERFVYGNGVVHKMTQNERGLPETSYDQYYQSYKIKDAYDYDPNGNVFAISDGLAGARGDRTMTYDGLDRLKTVVSPMYGTNGATYTYDVLDNLTRVRIGGTHVRDHWYCYDENWRLTNIKTNSCSGATVVGLGYDEQGNLANKNGQTYAFDFGNRLRAVAGKESYRYDGQGRRVLSWSVTGLGNILSHYDVNGVLRYQSDARRDKSTAYLYLGSSLVATREAPFGSTNYTIKYQHTDALGSPVAVTDANRVVLERSEYEPYGQVLNRPVKDGPGYTGHVEDAATGLINAQQRYLDPMIGRFLSVDPVTADGATGANFNRYWYANNNPYRFTDPDGRLSYETKLRGEKLPVHIDDNLPMKEQKQLQTKVNAGIEKLNNAKLSKQETAVIQNVKSLDVSGTAERSFIQESTGALTFTTDYVNKSSSTWLGSAVAHDGMHGELFKAGGVSLSRGLPAEVGAMKFQLRVGEKMGMSASDKGYLNNLISNPVLLNAYINTPP